MDGHLRISRTTTVLVLLAAAVLGGVVFAAGEMIPRHLVSSGGGQVSSANLALRGAAGQPVAGSVVANLGLCSGFLCGPGSIPTAVELAFFGAAAQGQAILVEWETASELDNLGFNLYRSDAPDGLLVRLNEALIPSQNPGSPVGAVYTWLDASVAPGVTCYYWLEDVDVYGRATRHGPVSVTVAAPGRFRVFVPLVRR